MGRGGEKEERDTECAAGTVFTDPLPPRAFQFPGALEQLGKPEDSLVRPTKLHELSVQTSLYLCRHRAVLVVLPAPGASSSSAAFSQPRSHVQLRTTAAMGRTPVPTSRSAQPGTLPPQTLHRVCLLTRVIAFHARRHAVSSRPGDPPIEALHSLWELGKKRD